MDLLAGNPSDKAGRITDGARHAARFNQPRGICQLVGGSNDLLVVDHVGATAVVRLVERTTGEAHSGSIMHIQLFNNMMTALWAWEPKHGNA